MKTAIMTLLAITIISASAYAGGSVNKKDKEYGNCLVQAPKTCGGYRSTMTPEEYKTFQACTSVEYKKCYEAYTK